MKKIIYSGFYGFQNSGDDVFLETTAWATKKMMNDSFPLYFGNNLPQLVNPYEEYAQSKFKGHDRLIAAYELRNAKFFVSAGGSTFSRHKKNSYKEIAEYAKRYYNKNLKTGAIGVSIGPFKSEKDEKDVQEYLKKIDFLSVRDRRSFEYVSQLKLPYNPVEAFDLAALLPRVYSELSSNEVKTNNKKIIGISICPVESISDKTNIHKEIQRFNRMSELIQKLNRNLKEEVIFRFFIINGNPNIGDEKMTRRLIENSQIKNYEIIPYQKSVFNIWNLIKQSDFMIATRLHAAIIAAYAEVPFILNEYHQKCTDFVKDIGQAQEFIVKDAEYNENLVQEIINVVQDKNKYDLKFSNETQELALNNFNFSLV